MMKKKDEFFLDKNFKKFHGHVTGTCFFFKETFMLLCFETTIAYQQFRN